MTDLPPVREPVILWVSYVENDASILVTNLEPPYRVRGSMLALERYYKDDMAAEIDDLLQRYADPGTCALAGAWAHDVMDRIVMGDFDWSEALQGWISGELAHVDMTIHQPPMEWWEAPHFYHQQLMSTLPANESDPEPIRDDGFWCIQEIKENTNG